MPPVHFNVSQVRVAAACPRILYFDADHTRRKGLRTPLVTRIWKPGTGDEASACGTLFHAAIDRFNRQAGTDPELGHLLDTVRDSEDLARGLLGHVYRTCLNQEELFRKPGPQQAAFMAALRVYLGELADILAYALAQDMPRADLLDHLFGDRRRQVNVTFEVGPHGEPVHVTGTLDYVFYDWRTGRQRILDYKLTPPTLPGTDLFQVCVYALMHNVMHHTEADAGVLYLHPARHLVERRWEEIHAGRGTVFNLLASMREWVGYDEAAGTGLKPPGDPVYCSSCRWRDECVPRLGPKHEGQRLEHWSSRAPSPRPPDPPLVVHETLPPAPGREAEKECAQPTVPPSHSLWIGSAVKDGRPVTLLTRVLPTHVAVVGAAGSGKTWLAKVLAEEAILQGIPVLAIDPQGDLVQFLRRRDPASLPEPWRRRSEEFCQRVEPRILTPGSSHGIRISLSPIRLAGPAGGSSLADPARKAEEQEGMLAALASSLVSLARSGGEEDSQRTFLFQVLKRLAQGPAADNLHLDDLIAAINRPEEVGLEDADAFVKKAERQRLARKLNTLRHGTSANLFTGGLPLDVTRLCRPVKDGKVPLNVVYLNALHDDDQKQFFVAALAAEVYRWMTLAEGAGEARLLVYLDEARDYIPAGTAKPPAKMPLLRLFAQGRKYGVGCLLCTQSPRSVDYNVFGNCSTKVIGRLESAQDVERVAEWFAASGPAPSWLRGRAAAPAGTFVARWPDMPPGLEGELLQSRPLFSLHEGAWSPDRVEQEMHADPVRRVLMGE